MVKINTKTKNVQKFIKVSKRAGVERIDIKFSSENMYLYKFPNSTINTSWSSATLYTLREYLKDKGFKKVGVNTRTGILKLLQ